MILALLACTPKTAPPSDTAQDWGCGGPIYVAMAGYDDDDPELADRHAEVFGAAPDPYHLHVSWYDEPSTSMAVVWRTDGDTLATQVEYGVDETYGTTVDGASFFVGLDQVNGRAHEARLCGLSPGTTYHYRVGGDGHWSADHAFTTAPTPGVSTPFVFALVGDSRGNQDTFATVLDQMDTHAPDFYLFTGDAVDIGVDMEEWDAWFDAGIDHFESRPLLFTHGNHEFQTQNFYALIAAPGNEQWFSLDYADAHFAVLNDTVARDGDMDVQATWLQEDLAGTSARWKFATHHQSAYSSCTTHGSNLEVRKLWSPIEDANGVVMDLAGHNHNYERSVPLSGGVETTPETGTTYIVAAGAGADLYGNDLANSFTAVAASTEHYAIVSIADGTLTLTTYDLAGNVIDTFSTTR